MGTIKIVADSSMTIEPELVKALDITVVPLSVMIDSKLYSDNDLKEEGYFLSLMKASKSLPKTSQPPVGLLLKLMRSLLKKEQPTLLLSTCPQLYQELSKHHAKEQKLLKRQ